MKGKVKWFNEKKGYGFILTEDKKEVFVHFSDIIADGFKVLNENDEVTFELAETEKGFVAKNVKKD